MSISSLGLENRAKMSADDGDSVATAQQRDSKRQTEDCRLPTTATALSLGREGGLERIMVIYDSPNPTVTCTVTPPQHPFTHPSLT